MKEVRLTTTEIMQGALVEDQRSLFHNPILIAVKGRWLMTDIVEKLRREKELLLIKTIEEQAIEIKRLREALEIIAGDRPCLDNLMGNVDVARAALTITTGDNEG